MKFKTLKELGEEFKDRLKAIAKSVPNLQLYFLGFTVLML
jgi:hypothetical protein